jgi:hypothetical protein
MKRAYLFIYSDEVGTREELKEVFDTSPSISSWRYDIPHCFYLLSEKTAYQLYEEFSEKRGIKGRFLFMEYNPNSQGQLLSKTWHFLVEKEPQTEENEENDS